MSRLLQAFRAFTALSRTSYLPAAGTAAAPATSSLFRSIYTSPAAESAGQHPAGEMLAEENEHETGLARAELDAAAQGVDIFGEEWLNSDYGTPEKPVEVTSFHSERIIGVTDPDDDCHVIWGVIKQDEAPRQIVEDGEFFVLKKVPAPEWALEH